MRGERPVFRSTKAEMLIPATHIARRRFSSHGGPLNEGRDVNPGDTRARRCRGWQAPRPLNEGRDVNPGDTAGRIEVAEHGEARSTKAEMLIPATRGCTARLGTNCTALNEGRDVNPGDTRPVVPVLDGHRVRSTKAEMLIPATLPAPPDRCCCRWPLNEGRDVNPGDTTRHITRPPWSGALNEGRDVNPGDTAPVWRPLLKAISAQRRPRC